MKNNEIISELSKLVQLDVDAIVAYNEALKKIEDLEVQAKIAEFRGDHYKHVDDLSEAITKLGGKPPKEEKDLKGYLIKGFTSLRSITGTTGSLKAMHTNEKLTNSIYEKTLCSIEWPADLKSLIQKNFQDEQKHLKYIEQILESKSFKQ